MISKRQAKAMMLRAGVANLKEFGYPSATAANIITDYVFSKMFRSMLTDEANVEAGKRNTEIEAARVELLAEVDAALEAEKGAGK